MDLRAKQYQYELESDAEAAAARLEALRSSALSGDLELPRASRFIAQMYSAVRESIQAECDTPTRGIGGKFKGWLRKVPGDVAAVIAIRTCVQVFITGKQGTKPVTLQMLARAIGQLYETEIRIAEANAVNPMYMGKVLDQLEDRRTKSTRHTRGVVNAAYTAIMKGAMDSTLSQSELMHLGKYGVQACVDAGMVTLRTTRTKVGLLKEFELVPEVYEFLTDYDHSDVRRVFSHDNSMMWCAPDPWDALAGGGFLTPRRKLAAPLMSTRNIRRPEIPRLRAEFTADKMPEVFECGNYLQSIPYSIHNATYNAVRAVWESGGGVMGIPRKNPPARPVMPLGESWVKAEAPEEELEVFTKWKRDMVRYYEDLKVWKARVREIGGFLRAIGAGQGTVWFPVFMDSRGRWYYRGAPNPQGSDTARAVLHLGTKKPLGKRGLYWLRVSIANAYGFDKVSNDERAAWTVQNWESIQRALQAPGDYPEVWGTDSPWCMYTTAYELNQALLSGDPSSYCTGVPVHQDATCSGLQHFAALLRDPVGAQYVNLTAFVGPKQDIYGRVGSLAMKAAERDSQSTDPAVAEVAQWWLSIGVSRNMAKKPVMTYVYGSTMIGTARFLEEVLLEEHPDLGLVPFAKLQYMATLLMRGVASTVPAADAAMRWLREVAGDNPNGKRMEWRTPTGFLVQHDYQAYNEERVRLRSCGVTAITVRDYTEGTRPVPMRNAISPNFIHSMDAAHLTRTVLTMQKLGLSVSAIHDSFGTHPCDVDAMGLVIRDEFIRLYSDPDILINFLWDVGGVGSAPMKGTFDLTEVRDSEYFFS